MSGRRGEGGKGGPPLRRLVLCADDYALHPLVDQAVQALARAGRLSATSCMTTAPHWPAAAAALRELRPALALGLHFNLTEGHGGHDGHAQGGALTLGQVLRRAYAGGLRVPALRVQWAVQLDAFERALGTPPDFIDGHQHVHQLPGVRQALLQELQARYGAHEMPWVRSTWPAGSLWRSPKAAAIALLGGWTARRQLRRAGVVMNRGFGGVYAFDAPDVAAYRAHMRRWLSQLPDGGLLMCHPAAAPVPRDGLAGQRVVEWDYLRSQAFARDLAQAGCRLHQGPMRG